MPTVAIVLNIRPDFIATETTDAAGRKWVEYRNYKGEVCATFTLDLQMVRSAVIMPPPIPDGYEPPPATPPPPDPDPDPPPIPDPPTLLHRVLIDSLNVRSAPDTSAPKVVKDGKTWQLKKGDTISLTGKRHSTIDAVKKTGYLWGEIAPAGAGWVAMQTWEGAEWVRPVELAGG